MTDDIDQLLIKALMEDSRRSLKALAHLSGLSAPSVSELAAISRVVDMRAMARHSTAPAQRHRA